jgi:UDP-N-acetylmuramate--L-alanine ligase/UDP-N-acetylenolpyruvoylglucosamine reductase
MADATDYELVRRLLARNPGLAAHAMGICGVGLAGVAQLLQSRGWAVSGCDLQTTGALADGLRRDGLTLFSGHDAAHVAPPCDLLIRSSAVADSHPEILRARALGIPVVRRGEVLAALVGDCPSVAVCGTHGKTTTSCFTLRLLQVLGADPRWCIGGATAAMGGVAGCSGQGPLVVEGDESDGTLAHYAASVVVVTNVDADHLEHFRSLEALHACFAAVLARARSGIVYCADDAVARALCAPDPSALSYGFSAAARLRIAHLQMTADRMTLGVVFDGRDLGEATLQVTGRHNALNAVAALGAAIALGHDPAAGFSALAQLTELPGRRFERLLRQDGIAVISDYSHHPAEIAALIALARLQQACRIVAVFQPHRYTRTLALGQDFPQAFAGVDELVLLPVYAASEAPQPGGETTDLYGIFRRQALAQVPVPRLAESLEAVAAWLLQELREGDLLLVIGAGDVVQVGHAVAQALRMRLQPAVAQVEERLKGLAEVTVHRRAPLAALTTLGVGGPADLLVEAKSEAGLAAVLRLCHDAGVPCRLLGGGSNTLVSDLGVRGVVVRLAGAALKAITIHADGRVVAGGAASGLQLLNGLTKAGLAGLDFMEGIPGTVGGWVAMNAGAHGDCIGHWVRVIRGLKSDGSIVIVDVDDAGFEYRRCRGLEGVMAVQVEFALKPGDSATSGERRRLFREKRLDFEGHRSAGSIFCNPDQATAGQLLDAAGCKALRVGGARVFARHANVIVTEPGATASDVLALMAGMRARVLQEQGVELRAEVRVWRSLEK